jgi:CRP-like cAMP-binding protein
MDFSEYLDLHNPDLKGVFANASTIQYKAGKVIIYRGDQLKYGYYITKGIVRMYTVNDNGDERTMLLLGKGDTFPLINTREAVYFYEAHSDCELLFANYETLIETIIKNPKYMAATRVRSANNMKRVMKRLEIMGMPDSEDRVYTMLLFLSFVHGKPIDKWWRKINIKLTQQEIGNNVGLSRVRISSIFNRLQRKGAVRTEDGRIYVKANFEKEGVM